MAPSLLIAAPHSSPFDAPPPYASSKEVPARKRSVLKFFGRNSQEKSRSYQTSDVRNRNPSAATYAQPSAGLPLSTPSEPPPSYNEVSHSPHNSFGASQRHSNGEDRFAFLRSFDTVFLIDDSGSMAGRSWRETKEALAAITPICTKYDADGIDIHFLNEKDNSWYRNVKSPATVHEIFSSVRPRGATPTGQRLNAILRPYLARYQSKPETTKPLNIIVITDGEPTDDVESPIIAAAKKLDKLEAPGWQIGIQFFQVGNEVSAREHLKQLDDELAELAGVDDLRDMVDTVPWTNETGCLNAEGILKVVLGAVMRRLDRRRSPELYGRHQNR